MGAKSPRLSLAVIQMLLLVLLVLLLEKVQVEQG